MHPELYIDSNGQLQNIRWQADEHFESGRPFDFSPAEYMAPWRVKMVASLFVERIVSRRLDADAARV